MLVFDHVTQRFGSTEALSDVSLRLDAAVVGLVGVNGAGKSTLMKLAVGQIAPTKGSVAIDGTDPFSRLGRLGYCPQEADLPAHFTCSEFLTYLGWLRKVPKRSRATQAKEALRSVDLESRANDRIAHLSGGMRRRLLIAQALMGEPNWVLLDEPTTGLDPEQRASIRSLLSGLSVNCNILVSSHIIEDVAVLADHVVFLHDGRVCHEEPSQRGRDAASLERLFLEAIMQQRRVAT